MTRQEFKEKWIDNSFYWINKNNHLKLQEIFQEFGVKCHTGEGVINWHEGFNNLQVFNPDNWHSFQYYQKADMWHPNASYGEPKNYNQMLEDLYLIRINGI